MDILLTGGASRVTCQQPLNLSLLRRKLFGVEDHKEPAICTNTPRYSEKVLTGNWYEERVISPCPTDEWITTYTTHFKTHDVKDLKDDLYTIWKSREKSQGTGRKPAVDGDAYFDNMTSSYDLSFRILPRGLCGPRNRTYNARKNTYTPETEMALSYGNQTNYGLANAIKSKQNKIEESILPLRSIYRIDYIEQIVPKDLHKKRYLTRATWSIFYPRFPKPRGDMCTPDLRHLGISLSSRPTPKEPQNRSSRCEQICTWL